MLHQVILVEKTKFVYKLVSKVFKSKGVDCFVINEEDEFTFQIDDLKPQVIIANVENSDFAWLQKNVNQAAFRDFIIIGVGTQDCLVKKENIEYFDKWVNLPIEPYEFVDQIKKWSEAH